MTSTAAESWKIAPIGKPGPVPILKTADTREIRIGHPAVLALPGGRILVAVDHFGPGVSHMTGPKGQLLYTNHWVQGKLMVSNDGGQTWNCKLEYPFCNACMFRDGDGLYLLGHRGNLLIMRSADGGETWGKPTELTGKEGPESRHYQSPQALIANGNIYIALMRMAGPEQGKNANHILSPVIMKARAGSTLSQARSWVYSTPLQPIQDYVPANTVFSAGVPCTTLPEPPLPTTGRNKQQRPSTWRFPQPIHIQDPAHLWHGSAAGSIHVLFTAETDRNNLAGLLRLDQTNAEEISLGLQKAPNGRTDFLAPLPGGNQKFNIFYDDETRLFWLVSFQLRTTYSGPRPPHAPKGAPVRDEKVRLQLSFSENLIDWCFAGLIAENESPNERLTYPVASVRGRDLCVVCQSQRNTRESGSEPSANLVFYTVSNFRTLVY